MPYRLVSLLFFAALSSPLPAQNDGRDVEDGPVKMTPELALAIPLQQKGRDVTVKFPILINAATVVRPGMVLRVLYQPPVPGDSENLVLAHKGNMENSYSRPTSSEDSDQAKMSPEIAHALEGFRRTVWEVPINFQLALAQLPTDTLHLIYAKSNDRDLDDARLLFFDGLFLGSPSGGTSVLAVETGSKADRAGFKAGDRILSVDGAPVPDDLAGFPALWAAAKERAKANNAASFPFVVRSTGETGSHTLNLAMPPRIKSQLMDGFN